jgi:hypothetical protein
MKSPSSWTRAFLDAVAKFTHREKCLGGSRAGQKPNVISTSLFLPSRHHKPNSNTDYMGAAATTATKTWHAPMSHSRFVELWSALFMFVAAQAQPIF